MPPNRSHLLGDTRPTPSFDFTLAMRRLCDDMVARVDLLRHVDLEHVAVSFSQTRKATHHGMYATLTPLRFAEGRMHAIRRGRRWGVERLYNAAGAEILYILNFYLPRFLDLEFREKLRTVLHELWHIGPKFDGDIRRLGARFFAHGASQSQYDAQVDRLLEHWLAANPPAPVCEFLRCNFHELTTRHGPVFGRRIRPPKLVPLD